MWLLENNILQQMQQAEIAGVMPTAEQQAQYQAQHISAMSHGESRILTVVGSNAEIAIKGVLTKTPSFLAMLFGGGNTTYPELISALAEAERDPSITNITLSIDSPGGSVDGMFAAIDAIKNTTKPTIASVNGMAASAAFALASQADSIVAENRSARIGSVGVVAIFQVSDNEVSITSTNAPKKRPDVTTKAGQAMVREELDALHELFVDAIAAGRGVTDKKINADFGQGATLLADEALKRGMIDSIAGSTPNLKVVKTVKTKAAVGGNQPEAEIMNLSELKAQHPDVFKAAAEEGKMKERDRVTAHLTMGDASGDMKTAIEAIKDGSEMTSTLQASYMAAGMNRKDTANRQVDDTASTAGDGASASDDDETTDDVVAIMESKRGITAEAK